MDDVTDEALSSLPRDELIERARALQSVLRVARAVSASRESYPEPSRRLPWDGSLTGLAAQRREILSTEDLTRDDRVEPATRARLVAQARRAQQRRGLL
jgi:hypothetical protein